MPQRFTISGSYFNTSSWNNPSVWYGGIVPTASDQVFIRGLRTTINNTPGYQPWVGYQTLTVASTASFPDSGSFYTYTDRDEELKIDYLAVSASNRFISCSIDTSYYSWSLDIYPITESLPSKKGGIIPNGAYVQFKPGKIIIPSGSEIILSTSSSGIPALTIENGGDLLIDSGGTFSPNGYVTLNDGSFRMTGSALFKFNKNYPTSSTETGVLLNTCGIYANNFPMQSIIIDGPEVRTNSILSQNASIGDYYITVNDISNFEIEDPLFIGEAFLTQSRTDNGTLSGLRAPYVNQISSYDEVVEVTYKDTGSNRLYIKRVNGLEGKILATASSTEIITDEERFQIGDKVLIGNQYRTVITSSLYDLELADYNFQSGSTLSEWDTDITRSFYFNDWTLIPGTGLTQFTSTLYRHLFVKNIMLDNVKVEAWVSNLRDITTGSGSRAEYGIYIQSEPQSDFDSTTPTSAPTTQPLRTAFVIDPNNDRIYLRQKNYNNTVVSSSYTGSYPQDGLKKFTLEASRGFVKGYVNDDEILNEVAIAGTLWGRVGLYSNGNNCFVCTRYKVYQKTFKVVLDSPTTTTIGQTMYETGIEYNHNAGDKITKLYSTVIDPLEHVDYAFSYRGAADYTTTNPLSGSSNTSGSFPYIFGNNSSGSKTADAGQFWRLTNDLNQTYDLGNGFTRSVILDFGQPITFNRVAFLENFTSNLQNFTASRGIQFSGSNDIIGSFVTASNWVPLTSSIIDERLRTTSETFRSYNIGGPHTYRFLRIETNGTTRTTAGFNNFRGYRVRYNISSSLQVNNSSDLNIGDSITIIARNNMQPLATATNYSVAMFATGSLSPSSFLDKFNQDYKIISKSAGNVIYLDQPFEEGSIEKGAYVVKLNKQLNFSGSFASTSSWCTGRIAVLGNTQNPVRRMLFNNVGFQNLNNSFPYLGTGANLGYSGFAIQYNGWYNYMGLVQGCSFYNCFNLSNGIMYHVGKAGTADRHNIFSGFTTIYQNSDTPAISAPLISTGNIYYGITGLTGLTGHFSLHVFSYNSILGGNLPLPSFVTPTNTPTYNYPYSTMFVIRRNGTEGVTGQFAPAVSADNIGTNANYIVDHNRFGYINNNGSVFFTTTFMDKAFETPFILPKRGGMDARRVTPTVVSSVSAVNYGMTKPTWYITNYIKDYNRLGYNVWTNTSGWWLRKQNDPYYRFYRHAGANQDWRTPQLAASFYLEEGVSASFDVSFNYYQTWNIFNQVEQVASGSIYMLATKDGNEVELISGSAYFTSLLPKSQTPTLFTKTYSFTGSGHFQIALAGMVYRSGYTAFSNISSRLSISDPNKAQVFTNTFNERYFDNGDKWMAKSMYAQPITAPKFRLKGSRIF
jgi:hypothetical protein